MRIGMFTASLPEPEHKPGGVDILIDRLADALVQREQDVTIFTYSPKPESATYEVRRLEPAAWRHRKLHRTFAIPLKLNGLDVGDVDVLHIHGDDGLYVRRPVPTVRTFYGSAFHELRTATRWRRRLSQTASFGLELLSSRLSTASYGLIPGDGRPFGVRGDLGCGVDPIPEGRRAGAPTVLFVGTWHGRKRGALLATQFERDVLPAVPAARLVMVSDEAPSVHDWLVHVPRPTDAELRELYQQAWAFCLPSAYEGLGIPYLEAMAAGTPVVATPNPGADFLLRGGRDGRIVAADDVGAALRDLLADDGHRAALAAAGRRRAADFSWDVVCRKHLDAYEHAVAVQGRRGRAAP